MSGPVTRVVVSAFVRYSGGEEVLAWTWRITDEREDRILIRTTEMMVGS